MALPGVDIPPLRLPKAVPLDDYDVLEGIGDSLSPSDGIQSSYCKQMLEEFDSKLDVLATARKTLNQPLSMLDNLLGDFEPSPNLDSGLDSLKSGTSSQMPPVPKEGEDEQDYLDRMLEQCPWLAALLKGGVAVAQMVSDFLDGVIGSAKELLSDIGDSLKGFYDAYVGPVFGVIGDIAEAAYDALAGFADDAISAVGGMIGGAIDAGMALLDSLPEINIGNMLDKVNGIFAGFGISSLIGEMDEILDCLSGICGLDVDTRVERMNTLLADIGAKDDGSFDTEKKIQDAGIPAEQKEEIDKANDTVKMCKVAGLAQTVAAAEALESNAKANATPVKPDPIFPFNIFA